MERLAGRVMLLWDWPRRLVACLGGAFATLALAPIDFPAAGFVAFPVLVWLIDGTPTAGGPLRRFLPAFSAGWWFGFGYFLAGMWWVGAPFLGDAGRAWGLPFAVIGLPAVLALFYGLATLVARLLWSDGIGRIAALAFGFGVAEWLRAALLPGFAWNAIGYAAMPVPLLMQPAALVGIAGMSAAAVFVFAAPALLGTRLHARAGLALAGLLIAAQAGYGYHRLAAEVEESGMLHARIVQPAMQAGAGFDETFETYLDLTAGPAADEQPAPELVLWPELAVPFVLAERPELLERMAGALGEDALLVAGTVRDEGEADTGARRLYNSLVAVERGGGITDASDKVRLFPFIDGQFFEQALRAAGLATPTPEKAFSAGSGRRLLSISDRVEALPLVGAEAAEPGIAEAAAGNAQIILNPAGYAALAGTPATYQHLRQAQLRAVEAGLALLVAMPDGPSAAVDSRGRIMDALVPGRRGVLDVTVPLGGMKTPQIGNISLRGLVFSAIFGVFALLLIICVGISASRN